jgi:CRP/FNR family transcriptional regulator, nitrogen oxide reductase regulator
MLGTEYITANKCAALATERLRLKSRFLDGLAPLEVDEIVTSATPRRFLANSIVIDQQQPAGHLFLLTKGRARYFFIAEGGRKLLLHWLVPGEIFGGAALLPEPASYLVGTEMVEDGVVLVWGRSSIRRLARKYPRLLDNALPIFADYLALYVATHVALTCHTARQRLAQALVTLARGIGRATRGGIELDVTNEELANASNITVFTASRLLNEWQRRGLLTKSRRKLLLRFPERLVPRDV